MKNSKQVQAALAAALAILSLVFSEGAQLDLNAQTIAVAVSGFLYLAIHYGVQGAINEARGQLDDVWDNILKSKRFWITTTSILSAVIADVSHWSYSVDMFGLQWDSASVAIAIILVGVGVVSWSDFVSAWSADLNDTLPFRTLQGIEAPNIMGVAQSKIAKGDTVELDVTIGEDGKATGVPDSWKS